MASANFDNSGPLKERLPSTKCMTVVIERPTMLNSIRSLIMREGSDPEAWSI
jgi:hypothetical protein